MKKHIITITGLPGSGKSSTADEVARTLNYTRFSGGDFGDKSHKNKNFPSRNSTSAPKKTSLLIP